MGGGFGAMNPATAAATRDWPAAVAALSASTLVGTMPLVARQLYAVGLSPPSLLFWRYALALSALGLAASALHGGVWRTLRGGSWRILLIGATLGSAQTLCFWESIKTLDTSIAVLLFYTYPALTLVIDRLVFKAPICPLAAGCIAAILVGAALITAPGLRAGLLDPRGLAWALPSPLIYAFYLGLNARLLRQYPPIVGAFWLFSGMALTFALIAGIGGLDVPQGGAAWALILFIALGPGALTMTLFSFAVPRLGASGFAILANAELVTVVLIGTLMLGEPVTASRAAGGTLIVAGILTHALARRPLAVADRPPSTVPPNTPASSLASTPTFAPSRAREGQGGGTAVRIAP